MKISSNAPLTLALLAAAGLAAAPSAQAGGTGPVSNLVVRQSLVTGFVNNPTTNSADFQSAVAANGDTVDSNVNFEAVPVGGSYGAFYAASDGLTFSSTGINTAIQNGAGPGQFNTLSGPVSPGEGVHAASNYLFVSGVGSLTLSFAAPVAGVGFSTIDLYNPGGANPISITAYSGAGGTGAPVASYSTGARLSASLPAGTGTNLGTFSAVGDNFQANNLYFMGVADSTGANTIGSLVLSYPNTASISDEIGIDNVLIAQAGSPVPEASTTASFGLLLALGLGGLAVASRRRKAATPTV